ncbi:hypothetical protein ABZW18_15360 [Streptomyces sp. NPDC004647]|uniref:hypothetical protein n=1 Tax=Streptomyces sp. NPDC004647 TaxID=3154671 RepID=UPI0033AF582F
MGTGTHNPRPEWLPPRHVLDAVRAGRWWDAIAVEGDTGLRLVELLRAAVDGPIGPVVCDPLGPVRKTYFLVPPHTSDRWTVPGTEALGECCYVGMPGSLDADTSGVHWLEPPSSCTPRLVRPQLLRELLAELRAAA